MATALHVVAVDPDRLDPPPATVDDDPLGWLLEAPGTRHLAAFRSEGFALEELTGRIGVDPATSWAAALTDGHARSVPGAPPGLAAIVEAERWVMLDRDEHDRLVAAVDAGLAAAPDWATDPIEGFGPDWALLTDVPVDEPFVVWAR